MNSEPKTVALAVSACVKTYGLDHSGGMTKKGMLTKRLRQPLMEQIPGRESQDTQHLTNARVASKGIRKRRPYVADKKTTPIEQCGWHKTFGLWA